MDLESSLVAIMVVETVTLPAVPAGTLVVGLGSVSPLVVESPLDVVSVLPAVPRGTLVEVGPGNRAVFYVPGFSQP